MKAHNYDMLYHKCKSKIHTDFKAYFWQRKDNVKKWLPRAISRIIIITISETARAKYLRGGKGTDLL